MLVAGVPVERVLQAFGLLDVVEIRPTQGGLMTDSVIVMSGQRSWVVKERLPWLVNRERMAFEGELFARLREASVPFPERLWATSAQPWATIEEKCFDVYEYVPGHPFIEGSKTHLVLAAETLARMHEAMGRICPASYPSIVSIDIRERLVEFDQTVTELRTGGTRSETERPRDANSASKCLQGLREKLLQTSMAIMRMVDNLPTGRQVIHGDYGPEHLIYDEDQIVAVLDFDASGSGHIAFDLASSLLAVGVGERDRLFARTYLDALSVDALIMDSAQLFLSSYSRVHTLGPSDVALILEVMMFWRITTIAWVSRWDREHEADVIVRKGKVLLEWLEENKAHLLLSLSEAVRR